MVGHGNNEKKVLIVNPGSSSLKFALFDDKKNIFEGSIEEIGVKVKSHEIAVKTALDLLRDEGFSLGEIGKVVYRIVYGVGLESPKVITKDLIKKLEKQKDLAPLHMPSALKVIKIFMNEIKSKHIACFDSSFHNEIEEKVYRYAIPLKISDKYKIRRYGFHGLAHSSLYRKVEQITGRRYKRVISCQLGKGASICAIKNGKSVDTSMGFTPLEGLMMGTRSGDLDSKIIHYLEKKLGKNTGSVIDILEKESGLRGIAGESDVRELLKMEKKGNRKAKLALDMFAYRVRKYIGSYIAVLGGVDLIVLGGGISRSWEIRKRILSGLEDLGISLDMKKIKTKEGRISKSGSKVEVYVFETDEQEEMFRLGREV